MSHPNTLDVVRALADPTRLAVAGAAASGPVSIEGLASKLGVPKKSIAQAVGDLRSVGLLDEDGVLDRDALRAVGRDLPKEPGPSGEPVSGPWTQREAEILGRFFDGDRLVEMPSAAGKRRLVLEKIAQAFEPGRRYPERDVNFKIQLVYQDYAAVRRYMIEEGFMDRADGAYWRTGGRYDTELVEPAETAAPAVLSTDLGGVELRPYEWEMLDALVVAANDPRIPTYMGDQFATPYTRDDGETWLEVATKFEPPMQYAIYVDDVFAGGLGGFPFKAENTGAVEIGWWLHPDYWRRGITTAAVRSLVDELFARGYMRLWAPVMRPNTASARVAEKAGMRLEGIAPSAYLRRGVRYDQLNYGLTRSQWLLGR